MEFAKLKAWVRLILTAAVVLAAIILVLMNWGRKADLWLFHDFRQVPVLWLIAVTAVVSIIAWNVIKGIRKAFLQVRKLGPSENKGDK